LHVVASVYSDKHIHVDGKKNKTTTMKGMYIAEKIESKYGTWGWNTNCGSCSVVFNKRNEATPSEDLSGLIDASNIRVRTYPNPNSGNFELEVMNATSGTMNVQVYDAFGKEIYSSGEVEISGATNLPIAIETAASGYYYVKAYINGEMFVSKVLIQN
jgi:hypothetical protein